MRLQKYVMFSQSLVLSVCCPSDLQTLNILEKSNTYSIIQPKNTFLVLIFYL